jgi:hypothetical protein
MENGIREGERDTDAHGGSGINTGERDETRMNMENGGICTERRKKGERSHRRNDFKKNRVHL